ncbi:HdeD family acid-resistance protein [Myroides pelagicus]|uniref:HdeD family acid-resistance protein n=1 Tax=Myroides pelagicus TaxID=270914 RepID=A0A7K1GJE2_9FLAO|nr:DUF308 domain-containing protein [Myroides pelagicus]MEC4113517.1 DUF308 domain-containing protein [Myroides pelagicus]MTH28354.1 HdeD family acid-resistance protein [Myroides pelagicus]
MEHLSILRRIRSSIKHWYIPVLLGVFFVVSGIYIFSTPLTSYVALTSLFSILFLFSGVSELVFAIANRKELDNWGWLLFAGVIDTLLGIVLITSPLFSMSVLPIYIGITLMFKSFRGMTLAFELKDYGVKNWLGIFLLSLLGLIFSFMMVANLSFGAFTIVYWTAFTFIFIGISSMVYGFQLKGLKKNAKKISAELAKRYEDIQEEVKRALNQD